MNPAVVISAGNFLAGLREARAQSRLYTGMILPGAIHAALLGSTLDFGRWTECEEEVPRRNAGRGGTGGGGDASDWMGGGERDLE